MRFSGPPLFSYDASRRQGWRPQSRFPFPFSLTLIFAHQSAYETPSQRRHCRLLPTSTQCSNHRHSLQPTFSLQNYQLLPLKTKQKWAYEKLRLNITLCRLLINFLDSIWNVFQRHCYLVVYYCLFQPRVFFQSIIKLINIYCNSEYSKIGQKKGE